MIGWETVGWNAPERWATHWRISDLVDNVTARQQEHERDDWLHWSRALGEAENSPVVKIL